MNKISIIVPIFNEADSINQLLLNIENSISKTIGCQIIIVDGGSTDGSQNVVKGKQQVSLITTENGRAKQMNAIKKVANGTIYTFYIVIAFRLKASISILFNKYIGGNWQVVFK
jgi:glycosyltransferase involved in cell wall biosynthesis